MRVLVTGLGGFAAAWVVKALIRQGHEVFTVRRRAAAAADGAIALQADLSSPAAAAAFPAKIDAVAHFAATSPAPGVSAARIVADNLGGLPALADWAASAGCRRFIFASSLSVYGRIDAAEVDEHTPIVAPDAYGMSKRLGEAILAEYDASLPVLALRLPGIIGPGCRENFLSRTLGQLRRHEPLRVFNPDGLFNNAVHVAELADFVAALCADNTSPPAGFTSPPAGFDAVTLGASGRLTLEQTICRLKAAVQSRSTVVYEKSERRAFTISNRRASERYGWSPMEIGALLDRFADETRNDASGGRQGR